MILTLLFAFTAFGAEDSLCRPTELRLSKRIPVPEEVNYFIRSAANREVGFATAKGNRILNVDSGEMRSIVGEIDPVPTPDGELYTVPVIEPVDEEGGTASFMTFLRRDPKNPKAFQDIFKDAEVYQNYQSLGLVSKSPKEAKYRLIVQSGNEIIGRDYTHKRDTAEVQPVGELRNVCGEALKNVSLPMLDKTGKNLSYFDYGKGSTVVYEIQEFGKKCRLTDELPAMAGKVDFSPDGKKLLFHADVSSGDSSQFSQPIPQYNLGVFLYDRTTKEMVPLHVKPEADSYYPVFLSDNELAFVSSTREAEGKTFHLNVAKLDGRGGCRGCVDSPRARARTALIGNLYARRCGTRSAPGS